jgi:uncharacterized protein YjiS (DUF1127 family)
MLDLAKHLNQKAADFDPEKFEDYYEEAPDRTHQRLTWLAGIALGWERRYQYRLLELDDRLLADFGVSRAAVEEVRTSHLYMIAWRDGR